ncbi:hypothetical protein [Bradyrhizobium sp.]|jgi:hypothetical protein|uniref:hypothetical protein n=1 Tax=Bradyrhizobium sp. TaxID=376 RepID=UPI0025BDA063|nr:hypothetical protein [Bradyrhizobium sp.]
MLISRNDGRMSRLLTVGAVLIGTNQGSGDRAAVVQPMPDPMRRARQRMPLRD